MPEVKNEKEIIQEVLDTYNKIKDYRANAERQWLINIAFLFGKQYVRYSEATKTLISAIKEELGEGRRKRARLVSNRILPIFMGKLARMLSINAVLDVFPTHTEEKDISAARVGKQVLEMLWRTINQRDVQRKGMLLVLKQLYTYMLSCGYSYLKPYFNPAVGEVIEDAERGDIREGEIEVDVLTPFEVFEFPLGRKILQVKAMSIEDIEEQYNKTVKPEKDLIISPVEQQLLQMLGEQKSVEMENAKRVFELWEIPSKKHPHGRLTICTKDELLVEPDRIPKEYKNVPPFFKFIYLEIPMSSFPQGVIDQLISSQKEYNLTISEIADYKKVMKGKLMIPTTCEIETEWDDTHGQTIKYNPIGGTPDYQPPPPLPAYIFNDLGRIEGDMEDIASFHDVCVDTETECMTKRGWLKYNEITKNDFIYTLNPKTLKGEWKQIENIHIHHRPTKMLKIEGRALSAYTTFNHKWLVNYKIGGSRKKFRFVETSNLNTNHGIPLTVTPSKNQKSVYSDDFVMLVGWVITEGNYHKIGKNSVRICQSYGANNKYVQEIKNILTKFGIQRPGWYSKNKKDKSWQICFGAELGKKIKELFPEKVLTYSFINLLNFKQLNLLRDTLLKGDGNLERKSFYTTERKMVDIFSYLCILTGKNCSVIKMKRGKTSAFIRGNKKFKDLYICTEGTKKCAYPLAKQKREGGPPYKIEETNSDITWCPETDNGTFVARRNNKIYVTGNSAGKSPGRGVTSGVAIGILQEQDAAKTTPILLGMEAMLSSFGLCLLNIAEKKYTEPRLLEMTGKNLEEETKEFVGGELTGKKDVKISLSATMSPAVRRQMIMEMAKAGVIRDPQQLLKLLEFGQVEELFVDLDETNAKSENQEMARGVRVIPQHYDNHITHLKYLHDYMKRPDFRKRSPEEQEIFLEHEMLHQTFLKKELAVQQQPAGAPKQPAGAPKGGG